MDTGITAQWSARAVGRLRRAGNASGKRPRLSFGKVEYATGRSGGRHLAPPIVSTWDFRTNTAAGGHLQRDVDRSQAQLGVWPSSETTLSWTHVWSLVLQREMSEPSST